MKTSLIAATLAIGTTAGVANADYLSGTFNIDIYNYNAGGSSAAVNATPTNLTPARYLTSVQFTGPLKFFTDDAATGISTIQEFLDSASGSWTETAGTKLAQDGSDAKTERQRQNRSPARLGTRRKARKRRGSGPQSREAMQH
jgi:hypothetical protein